MRMLKRYRDHVRCVWQLRSYLPVMAPGANAVAEATKATSAAIRASILWVNRDGLAERGQICFRRDIKGALKSQYLRMGEVS